MINPLDFPSNLIWFNSPPLDLNKLKGNVVLIDFWTYSCINCQRTLPYIKKWWEKYKDLGLVIIGVHSPEFEFEKDSRNSKEAIKKYKITWPNILDNEYKVWNLWGTHAWPTKHLINHTGQIIYSHTGEGNYLETEIKIQEALRKAGFLKEESSSLGQTPELYLGYLRGRLGNHCVYHPGENFKYNAEKYEGNLEPDLVYLHGLWRAEAEYLEHPRDSKELGDIILLSYRAMKVYLVMGSSTNKPIKVYLNLDGAGLSKEYAGSDVKFDKKGNPFAEVQFATLYNLVSTPTFGDHILKISTKEKGLRLYAFTFGS